MSEKTDKRRDALAEALIAAALAQIDAGGLASLRARDLAKAAGCSVGGVYTVFRDLDDLVLRANAETFRALGASVTAAVDGLEAAEPVEILVAMGHAYLAFAEAHTNRWLALFDPSVAATTGLPDWYLGEVDALFAIIRGPLGTLRPGLSGEEADVMVRTLFSAIHGIVLLAVQRRISAVPQPALPGAIEGLLRAAVGPGGRG